MTTEQDLTQRLCHDNLKGIFENMGFSRIFNIEFPEKEKIEGMFRFAFYTHPMFNKISNERYEFALLNVENSFSKKIFIECYFVMISKTMKNSYIILKKFSEKESFESRSRIVDFHDKVTILFTHILDAVELSNQISQVRVNKKDARKLVEECLITRASYPYSSIRDSSLIIKSSIDFIDEVELEDIPLSELFFTIVDRTIHFEKRSISFKRKDSDELFTTGGFLRASKRYYYFIHSINDAFASFTDKMIKKHIP